MSSGGLSILVVFRNLSLYMPVLILEEPNPSQSKNVIREPARKVVVVMYSVGEAACDARLMARACNVQDHCGKILS